MTSSSMSLFRLLSCLTVLSILPFISHATDPLQDICVADLTSSVNVNGFPCIPDSLVTSNDFFFDASTPAADTSANVNNLRVLPALVTNFPALNTQGLGFARFDMGVGGINTPHSHPRATEAGIVLSGSVLVGFVTTSNKLFSKVLTPGMLFLIPRALVHFQENVGIGNATFLAIFNSQNPGVSTAVGTLFDTQPPLPEEILTKSFQVNASVINIIKAAWASNLQGHQTSLLSSY